MNSLSKPGRAERHYWRDLWRYRELFQVLAWRDVAVRYKQTVIGVAWALVRPFLTMVVFTVVFGTHRQAAERRRRAVRAAWSSPACCRGRSSPPRSPKPSNSLVAQCEPHQQGLFPAHHRARRHAW